MVSKFGEVIAAIVKRTEDESEFKVVDFNEPKSLKKLERIVEKVALRHEGDGCIAAVCDCVRMMVPVKK